MTKFIKDGMISMTLAKKLTTLLAVILTMSFSNLALAQQFVSTDAQVPLIELYTSEGCSSCPPADKWLSGLKTHESLWNGFVPVALHVDYWDYIGWEDPYASHEYSQRQRQIAAEHKERTVYTPGIRKAGDEWRSWRLWGSPTDDDAPIVGKLEVSVDNTGEFSANFASLEGNEDLQLNVAVLGLGLSNEVTRGENSGKTLKHDFVVLGLSRFSSANANSWSGSIEQPDISASRYAIAAWVSEKGRTKPVQSTGGYLTSQIWKSAP